MRANKVSYAGKKVFIGFDVHKSFYVLTAICDDEIVKRCRIAAVPEQAARLILASFKGAKVKSCYEAGFSGYGLHRVLIAAGIENLVVNAGSVEVSSRDRVKTDKRDSKKLAIQLASGRLHGIRVPSEAEENARLLSRTREQLMKSASRSMVQIKMKLYQFGLIDPNDQRILSRKRVNEILALELSPELRLSIELLLNQWEGILMQQRKCEKELEHRGRPGTRLLFFAAFSLPSFQALCTFNSSKLALWLQKMRAKHIKRLAPRGLRMII